MFGHIRKRQVRTWRRDESFYRKAEEEIPSA